MPGGDKQLEVSVSQGQSLNQLFSELSGQGINVLGMRNKSNRLEELFVSLVGQTDDQPAGTSS